MAQPVGNPLRRPLTSAQPPHHADEVWNGPQACAAFGNDATTVWPVGGPAPPDKVIGHIWCRKVRTTPCSVLAAALTLLPTDYFRQPTCSCALHIPS
jgi:hypothetical protein